MAYAIELPTGQIAMTLEPSLLNSEIMAVEPLKLAIHKRGRTYNPDTRIWTIEAAYAANLQEVFREQGLWLAWITELAFNVFVPLAEPIVAAFDYIYDPDYKYAEWVNSINAGEPGRALAHVIRQNTNLLEVLSVHGVSAVNGQIAINLARANGDPTPLTTPRPPPPIKESGALPVAYMIRGQVMRVGKIGTPNFYQAVYRFSLITDPNNFCGKLNESHLRQWASNAENAEMNRLALPPAIDAQDHYAALELDPRKIPTRAQARAAFAAQSLLYHPDHNRAANAAEMFKPVLAAWEFFRRANNDDTGRVFKMYNAMLRIKSAQGKDFLPAMIAPALAEHKRAAWLFEYTKSGLLTGSWLRDPTTGEIVIETLDDLTPLKDSKGRVWQPAMTGDIDETYNVSGTWVAADDSQTR